ncbi:hypothetical protein LZ554_000464 [Drepanopeziza brunnea f. sp. 'monogermtubi']|nr:hypothetical protein LZ554_000464 [Drepanopeziza brunnea f. sp. 'monogermtubi']
MNTVEPMYYYFTQGVAVSEVELDILTGSRTVLCTDTKMDIGRSIVFEGGRRASVVSRGDGIIRVEGGGGECEGG